MELSEFCSKTPTRNLLVSHFGNGDEDDQNNVLRACEVFGEVEEITIIPGASVGLVVFKDVSSSEALFAAAA
jgi:hypothetical protein